MNMQNIHGKQVQILQKSIIVLHVQNMLEDVLKHIRKEMEMGMTLILHLEMMPQMNKRQLNILMKEKPVSKKFPV